MFFSKRSFKARSSSLRRSGDKSFFLFLNGSCMVSRFLRSRLSSRLRRPGGHFNTELLGILGVQPLPARGLHGLAADDGPNRLIREEPLKNVEADVPARGAPRDEAAIDFVPQCQARAATEGFEFPPGIVVLKQLGSIGLRYSCFERRG